MARNISEETRLLTKASKFYYDQGLTQREIADRLHISRSTVSRLLQRARDIGIVQITVHAPPGMHPDLEYQLESKFGLKEAVVVEASDPVSHDGVVRDIGATAADYLRRTLNDGDVIGVTWGTTLNAMVAALHPSEKKDVHVVQILGGLGPPEADEHATALCTRMARYLDSKLTLLPAPGIVENQQAKEIILSDTYVQRAFDMIPLVNVAYVGIGAPTPHSVVMRDGTIMSEDEVEALKAKGAVGDIALRFFDRYGQPVASELNDRVIAVTLDEIKGIEHVVGIAGGPAKTDVIRGALLGGLVDVLITDHATATRVLETSTTKLTT